MALTKEEKYARKRAWYALNKEKVQAQQKEWRERNRERISSYGHKRWVEKRDLLQQRNKNWWAANKEAEKARQRQYRRDNPDKNAIYEIRKRYQVSLEEAVVLLARRRQGCEVCHSVYDVHIDHDHVTGKVRGILCSGCNVALGRVKDRPEILIALADYLRRNS